VPLVDLNDKRSQIERNQNREEGLTPREYQQAAEDKPHKKRGGRKRLTSFNQGPILLGGKNKSGNKS
jgi:hypothetical protein